MLGNNKHHYLQSLAPSLLPHTCCPVHGESSKYQTDAGSIETCVTEEDAEPRHPPIIQNVLCLNWNIHQSTIMHHIQQSNCGKVIACVRLSLVIMIRTFFSDNTVSIPDRYSNDSTPRKMLFIKASTKGVDVFLTFLGKAHLSTKCNKFTENIESF